MNKEDKERLANVKRMNRLMRSVQVLLNTSPRMIDGGESGAKARERYDRHLGIVQAEYDHLLRVLGAAPAANASEAISRAVFAFVKHGYAAKHRQPNREAEATNEFDSAIADLRAALAHSNKEIT